MNRGVWYTSLVGLALALAACRNTGTNQAPSANHSLEIPPVHVRVETLHPVPFQDVIHVAGVVKAYEDVLLSPKEGGVVKEWKVEKGRFVRKGEIIALLDDEVIRASLAAAEAQYNLAQLNYEMQQKMYAEQSISELQYRSAQYNRDAALAQADLMRARRENTRIQSPIDGILDDRLVDQGEFAPPAVPMARLVNLSRVKIVAEIPEIHANVVATGTAALVTLDAVPGDTLSGRITFTGKAISSSNRTMPVEIMLDNRAGKLKPEMVAKVRVLRETRQDALMISENLVLQVDRNKLITYVENNGHAAERVVKLGGRQGSKVEVVSGLQPGDRLIVAGYQKLVDGHPVVVVDGH